MRWGEHTSRRGLPPFTVLADSSLLGAQSTEARAPSVGGSDCCTYRNLPVVIHLVTPAVIPPSWRYLARRLANFASSSIFGVRSCGAKS